MSVRQTRFDSFDLDRRASPRIEVDQPGKLICGADGCISIECQVLDLSDGGAKVESSVKSNCEDRIALQIGNTATRPIRHCWTAEDYVGVAFTDQLTEQK